MIVIQRLLVRGVLPIVSAVLAWIGVLHIPPYPFPEAFELALPDETCGEMCVFGVTPGITTLEQAETVLNAHPHIETTMQPDRQVTLTYWRWSGDHPAWLLDTPTPYVRASMDGVVYNLRLQTAVPLRHFRVRLGLPDSSQCFSNLSSVECLDTYFYRRDGQLVRYSLQTSLAETNNPLDARARVTITVEDQREVTASSGQNTHHP